MRVYTWPRCYRHVFDDNGKETASFLPESHTQCGWHEVERDMAPEPKLISREDWVQLAMDAEG